MQEFLEIERNNELMQRQELELANSNKFNREKVNYKCLNHHI